jgi:Tol biopolymer transport system component
MSLRKEMARWPAIAFALLVFGCDDNQSAPTDPSGSSPLPSPSTIVTAAKARSGAIAFSTDRDGNNEIYTMSPRGKDLTRLTNDPASDTEPQWSFDGTKLVFVRAGDIFVMNADGSGQTNLTNTPPPSLDVNPTWSPDGSKIAFTSFRDGGFILRLYVMNADGSNVVRISTPDPSQDHNPAWSPSGDRIAFVRSLEEGSAPPVGDIFVVNPDGSGLTNVTNNPAEYITPSWSPTGAKIAFSGNLPGFEAQSSEIFVMNADGTGRVDVSNNPAYDFDPDWSADGRKLVFTSARVLTPHNYDIFVMDADGRHQRSLTGNSLANETSPDWSP